MKLNHLSASRIKTFQQCPLKYKAIYEDGLTSPEHPASRMGKALHEAAEKGIKDQLKGEKVDFQENIKFFSQKYILDREYTDKAFELMNNALKWGYLRNIEHCEGVEVRFNHPLSDNTYVTGYIDRLDLYNTKADIIDLKTQKYAFKQHELMYEWQSVIYNWAVRQLYPEITDDVTVSYWVLRHQVQRCWLTAKDAEQANDKLILVAENIRDCHTPQPKPSVLCKWCPKYDECIAVKKYERGEFYGKKKR